MGLAGLLDLEGYRVKAGSVDARGWPVYDLLDEYVGTIEDLIVDTDVLEARYVQIALDGLSRSIVLALNSLVIEGDRRRVHCPRARKEDLQRLPYIGGLDRDAETGAIQPSVLDQAVFLIGVEPDEEGQ
jgi:hypothetical protein